MTPPSASPSLLRASGLRRGARGVVAAVEGGAAEVERLSALGVVPGATIEVVREGSPLAVAVGATRLALGRPWAEAVLVVPL